MPLQVSQLTPPDLAALIKSEQASSSTSKKTFVVVYASEVGGRMWCGDCRDAQPFVEKKFGGSKEAVWVVFAGNSIEWRANGNPWRKAPFLIAKLPTLVKIQDGKWDRLVEEDVYDQAKLDAFVDE